VLNKLLVVGGDSYIGSTYRLKAKEFSGYKIDYTTRKENSGGFLLDLLKPLSRATLPLDGTVLFCAGINGQLCEQNPAQAELVNCSATAAIAKEVFVQGGHFIYLSSTAVFPSDCYLPTESDKPHPTTLYGRLKAQTEAELMALNQKYGGICTVVRMPKVLGSSHPMVSAWKQHFENGLRVSLKRDYMFAPIGVDYLTGFLNDIVKQKESGIFHLAAARALRLSEFAEIIGGAYGLNCPIERINKSASNRSDYCVTLNMNTTINKFDIRPQLFDQFLSELSLPSTEIR
jgi:dTDP-4-dehydrorhamnose reductase